MCFDWCFGTRVLPFYRDSTIAAVRDCVARKRSYTYTLFKARQFLFTRTPDPLRTRSVRRASDSVQTALAESGPRSVPVRAASFRDRHLTSDDLPGNPNAVGYSPQRAGVVGIFHHDLRS